MSEQVIPKKKTKSGDSETVNPVHVVRQGAIAASIWKRQSASGYAYYDYTLSRSWKSMSSDKTGYSDHFSEKNKDALHRVIDETSAWIEARRGEDETGVVLGELAA